MRQEPFFLKSGNTQLYAVLFSPASPSPEKVFLFCHPLFEEKKSSHRVLIELGRKLAEDNCAVLMLDYAACGDSEGSPSDFTISECEDNIKAGIKYLNEHFNKPQITLLGIRFGAVLAVQCAKNNEQIKELILIDPIINGQAYINEILQQKYIREMMTFGEAKSNISSMLKELEQHKALDIDGVLITENFFDTLKSINLDNADLSGIETILLIQQSAKESLLPIYENLQNKCKNTINLELALLKTPPFWKAVDMADFATICKTVINWTDTLPRFPRDCENQSKIPEPSKS